MKIFLLQILLTALSWPKMKKINKLTLWEDLLDYKYVIRSFPLPKDIVVIAKGVLDFKVYNCCTCVPHKKKTRVVP